MIIHGICDSSFLGQEGIERAPRLGHAEKMESRFHLWKATDDLAHLSEAHRLLCHLRDHAPKEYQETMITWVWTDPAGT